MGLMGEIGTSKLLRAVLDGGDVPIRISRTFFKDVALRAQSAPEASFQNLRRLLLRPGKRFQAFRLAQAGANQSSDRRRCLRVCIIKAAAKSQT